MAKLLDTGYVYVAQMKDEAQGSSWNDMRPYIFGACISRLELVTLRFLTWSMQPEHI